MSNQIYDKEKFPKGEHFAAVVFETQSVHHPEEGHGYPAYTDTVHVSKYITFKDQAEMEAWVLAEETSRYRKSNYVLISAKPLQAKISSKVLFT